MVCVQRYRRFWRPDQQNQSGKNLYKFRGYMYHTSFSPDNNTAFLTLHPYLKDRRFFRKKLQDKEEVRYVKEIEQHAN